MILLYTSLLLFLVAAKFLIDRRVGRLERKYSQTAKATDGLLVEPAAKAEPLTIAGIPVQVAKRTQLREALPTKADLAESAKRQLQLGLLVQKRDRLEAKHDAWTARSERLGRWVARVRSWKGRKLPYTMGVLDVSSAMVVVDRFGLGHYVSVERLTELFSRAING